MSRASPISNTGNQSNTLRPSPLTILSCICQLPPRFPMRALQPRLINDTSIVVGALESSSRRLTPPLPYSSPCYDDSARDTKQVPSAAIPACSWNPDKRLASLLLRRGWELHNTNTLLVEWDEANVIKMLNGLFDESSDAALAFHFFRWSRRRKGTRHGIRVVCTMIHIAVSGNVNNLAMDFLRGIVKNPDGRKDWLDLIFDVLSETSRDWGVLEIAYSMLVSCYVRLRMIDMAVKLVGRMKNSGFVPSTRVCDCLISALLESKQFDYACDLFRDLQSSGCGGNRSISLFIREFCARGSFRTAFKLLLDTQNDSGIVDIVAYTIVIDALCKRGLLKEAAAILCKLIHTGATPDSVLLAVVIDGYCKAGRLMEAVGMLTYSDCVHDVYMYNSIISMLCNRGCMVEANQLFSKMSESGICPDSLNYSTVIGGYCKTSQMDHALKLFAKMLKRGAKGTVLTYTMLIEGYCRIGDLQGAESMLSALEREGMRPDVVTYNILIKGYITKGDINIAYEKMDIMTKNGVSPDVATYNTLMHGLVKKGSSVESREIFEELVRRGFSPDKITYTNIMNSYLKEGKFEGAYNLWCSMIRNGSKPDVVTCSVLLNGLCRRHHTQEAIALFNKMQDAGLEPDIILYNNLIWGFCREGRSSEAHQLLTMMTDRGVAPNSTTHMHLSMLAREMV